MNEKNSCDVRMNSKTRLLRRSPRLLLLRRVLRDTKEELVILKGA
jgi:hypothetical protein